MTPGMARREGTGLSPGRWHCRGPEPLHRDAAQCPVALQPPNDFWSIVVSSRGVSMVVVLVCLPKCVCVCVCVWSWDQMEVLFPRANGAGAVIGSGRIVAIVCVCVYVCVLVMIEACSGQADCVCASAR